MPISKRCYIQKCLKHFRDLREEIGTLNKTINILYFHVSKHMINLRQHFHYKLCKRCIKYIFNILKKWPGNSGTMSFRMSSGTAHWAELWAFCAIIRSWNPHSDNNPSFGGYEWEIYLFIYIHCIYIFEYILRVFYIHTK